LAASALLSPPQSPNRYFWVTKLGTGGSLFGGLAVFCADRELAEAMKKITDSAYLTHLVLCNRHDIFALCWNVCVELQKRRVA